jgi:hypothetical protein
VESPKKVSSSIKSVFCATLAPVVAAFAFLQLESGEAISKNISKKRKIRLKRM